MRRSAALHRTSTLALACGLSLAVCSVPSAQIAQIVRVPIHTWPTVTNAYGHAGPENGQYVLEATSNTWVGPGRLPLNAVLSGDFAVEIAFAVLEKQDSSLQVTLAGTGREYSQLDVFLDMWASTTPTFSAYQYEVIGNMANISRRFAERVPVESLSSVVWSSVNALSIRRRGNTVSLSLNKNPLGSFLEPIIPVSEVGVGLAFKSKIVLHSITATIPAR